MAIRQQLDLRLYLDVIPDRNKPEIPAGSIMVFLKHFDTTKQTLCGVGKVYMQRSSKVGDLVGIINERMRWSSGTPLKLYEVRISLDLHVYAPVLMSFIGNQAWYD